MSSRLLKQLFALCFNHRIPFLPPPPCLPPFPISSRSHLFPLQLLLHRLVLRPRHRRWLQDRGNINPLVHAPVEIVVMYVVTPFPRFLVLRAFYYIAEAFARVRRPLDHDDAPPFEGVIVLVLAWVVFIRAVLAVVGLALLLLLLLPLKFAFLLLRQGHISPVRVLTLGRSGMLTLLLRVAHRHRLALSLVMESGERIVVP